MQRLSAWLLILVERYSKLLTSSLCYQSFLTSMKNRTTFSIMSWLNKALSYDPYQALKMSLLTSLPLTGFYALYRWLLLRPLPGIPFNPEAAKSIWADVLELRNDPSGLTKWCGKQLEKHGLPVYQALIGPLSKPVVLVADVGNAREMLMGRSDFDRSAYIVDRFPLFGEFHLNMKTGDR